MNWGTKIVLGMIAFMLFIIAMVVYMFSVHGNDALVDEDYYEKGINYDQSYNATRNMMIDKMEPVITITKSQIIIKLKDSASYALKLVRPATQKDDILKKGVTLTESHIISIDRLNRAAGLWYLELNWSSNGKKYLFKSSLSL
ncbi:FixH family protein [Pedobacter sp. Du54]|uniref:FixH family protein n=1 Tax=Pedobacter anseongensis TaxID=3133439 RepID=UPI00309C6EE5